MTRSPRKTFYDIMGYGTPILYLEGPIAAGADPRPNIFLEEAERAGTKLHTMHLAPNTTPKEIHNRAAEINARALITDGLPTTRELALAAAAIGISRQKASLPVLMPNLDAHI